MVMEACETNLYTTPKSCANLVIALQDLVCWFLVHADDIHHVMNMILDHIIVV